MKQIIPLLSISSVLALSACSSSPNRCPIDQDGYPTCKSMNEVFDAAYEEGGDNLSVLGKEDSSKEKETDEDPVFSSEEVVFDGRSDGSTKATGKKKIIQREYTPISENPYLTKPVYVPEKVHRVWFAPWTGESGNLYSAEMVYFTTSGYWNYGSLDEKGSIGGAIMEPLAPDDYGFKPSFEGDIQKKHVAPEVRVFD